MPDAAGTPPPADRCLSCGSARFGRFCADCGEKRVDAADLRLRSFLVEAVEALTNADSRIWRSFRALLFRPGFLAVEHLAGRRRPWLGPVQLFVICNIAFFVFLFFLPAHVFTTRLSDQLYHHFYSSWAMGLETRGGTELWRLVEDPARYRRYAPAFNMATEGLAKSLIIVMVPGFALLLRIVHLGRRHFVEHLILAFHFFAVLLLVIMGVMLGFWAIFRGGSALGLEMSGNVPDGIFSLLMGAAMFAWLVPAIRRFHPQRWIAASARGLLLVIGQLFLLFGYRFLLLLLTLRTV
jgi:hypothetical protein